MTKMYVPVVINKDINRLWYSHVFIFSTLPNLCLDKTSFVYPWSHVDASPAWLKELRTNFKKRNH